MNTTKTSKKKGKVESIEDLLGKTWQIQTYQKIRLLYCPTLQIFQLSDFPKKVQKQQRNCRHMPKEIWKSSSYTCMGFVRESEGKRYEQD